MHWCVQAFGQSSAGYSYAQPQQADLGRLILLQIHRDYVETWGLCSFPKKEEARYKPKKNIIRIKVTWQRVPRILGNPQYGFKGFQVQSAFVLAMSGVDEHAAET